MNDSGERTDRFDRAIRTLIHNMGPKSIALQGLELTPGQVLLLATIRRMGEVAVSHLADRMEVKPSAITVMLDRLEAHDFVFRVRDVHDRRVVKVHLTEKGKEVLIQVSANHRLRIQRYLEAFGEAELDSFLHLLEKLAHVSSTLDAPPIPPYSPSTGVFAGN